MAPKKRQRKNASSEPAPAPVPLPAPTAPQPHQAPMLPHFMLIPGAEYALPPGNVPADMLPMQLAYPGGVYPHAHGLANPTPPAHHYLPPPAAHHQPPLQAAYPPHLQPPYQQQHQQQHQVAQQQQQQLADAPPAPGHNNKRVRTRGRGGRGAGRDKHGPVQGTGEEACRDGDWQQQQQQEEEDSGSGGDSEDEESQPQDPAALAARLVPQLLRMARVPPATAHEVLIDVLAGNADLKKDYNLWLEEAQIKLACSHEVDDEAEMLRVAMASSLADVEDERRKQAEEENREGRVAAVRRKYPDSALLAELGRVACPSLLVTSPAHGPLVKLLELEKRCKKWYSGRGTFFYYERLSKDLASAFRTTLAAAMNGCGFKQQTLTAPQPKTNRATAAAGNGPALPLLLACVQPLVACPTCGACATPSNGSTGPAGSTMHAEKPADAAAADSPAAFLPLHPQLRACFAILGHQLTEKEAHIQVEVSRMPPEPPPCSAGASSSGAGGAKARASSSAGARVSVTYVPELFKPPPGHHAMDDAIECFSDSD